jgi:hypothetical protein
MSKHSKRDLVRESRSAPDGPAGRRLAFLDAKLMWEGQANRGDLERRFGVSTAQASADFAAYLESAGDRVVYDRTAKAYVAQDGFSPVFAETTAGRYLSELRLLDAGIVEPGALTTMAHPLPFSAGPVPERAVDAQVLRCVSLAIRSRRVLVCRYRSMTRPEPEARRLAPRALAHDGFRWHVRAFDLDRGAHRDFVLGRLSQVRLGETAPETIAADGGWDTMVTLDIVPHPALSPPQAAAIRADYGFKGQTLKLTVRRALLFYALKRLGLDTDPKARAPERQHIILANRAEVMKLLAD